MKPVFQPSAIDLLEEAVQMLRRQPLPVLAGYYLGATPFMVMLWLFWSDMSRGARAWERGASEALALAGAFVWMKGWQFVFVQQLKGHLAGKREMGWSVADGIRCLSRQVALQSLRLPVLTLSMVLTVPFGWALAFFENLAVLGAEPRCGMRELCGRAWAQARLWPAQNHAALLTLASFGVAVLVNLALALGQAPALLKSLLGVETVFSRSPWALMNTTFLVVCAGLAFLALDPVIKAMYVLRCFRGESVRTGQDLRAELQWLVARGRALAVAGLFWASCLSAGAAAEPAGESRRDDPAPTLRAAELDRAITEVLRHPAYEWRLPREKQPEASGDNQGWLKTLLDGMLDHLRSLGQGTGHALERLMDWIGDFLDGMGRRLFGRGWRSPVAGTGIDFLGGLQVLLWLALALAMAGGLILAWRLWRWRGARDRVATETLAVPDLRSEEVSATQLPEDEWLRLAEELLQVGERRLAVRALYLAVLARLAACGWIKVARYKSNRDYELELRRRAAEWPAALAAFAENVRLFERAWYGLHEITGAGLDRFRANLQEIQTCAPRT